MRRNLDWFCIGIAVALSVAGVNGDAAIALGRLAWLWLVISIATDVLSYARRGFGRDKP